MTVITKYTPSKVVLELGSDCEMCGNCCSHGTGFLAKEDIPRIAGFLKITEKELKEEYLEKADMFNTEAWRPRTIKKGKPYGKCVFLGKKKECTIHEAKPFQCRISNCRPYGEQLIQWFFLNHFVNPGDPESVRQWASYLRHREWVIEGGNLDDIVPDREKLRKMLSYERLK